MHIGIDARLPYYRMGGISQYVIHLVGALADLDRENRYTLFHSRKDEGSYVPAQRNFERHDLWTPCHHRLERWTLALELSRHDLDLLHSPDFIPPAGGARRRIITVHDLNFLHYPQYMTKESRRYYAGQIGRAVEEADAIAADSEHTRQDLLHLLRVPADKIKTIHLAANPVFQAAYSEDVVTRTLQGFNLPRGFILFVGTLEPRKNVSGLLKAYASLRREGDVDTPLVLVGSKGWLYDDLFATVAALGLEPWVRHLPSVTDIELAHLYHAAGLLALPSHYEGFGLPVLEAMHCGCPVITSDRASLPEVAGSAAVLLPPDDTAGWASAMASVLTDSGVRRRMVREGHDQAARFRWSDTAEATLDLYQSTLP